MRLLEGLNARSITFTRQLENGLPRLMFWWIIFASMACGMRAAFAATPVEGAASHVTQLMPYILVVAAPAVSMMLALRWFPRDADFAQPETRLALWGRWRGIAPAEARAMPHYGAAGLMASLLLGMLLNVPVRMLEFLAAIPALGDSAPEWLRLLFGLMLIDVVVFSSLYVIACVAALRHVPLFPRMLAAIWGLDLLMQVGIARVADGIIQFPPPVAHALADLLDGNLKKVLISAAIWCPYLLLSRRVNLTYRCRVPIQSHAYIES